MGWNKPATPPTDRRPGDGQPPLRDDVDPHSRQPTERYKGGEPDEHWRSLGVVRSGAVAWAAAPVQRRLPLSVLRVRVRAWLRHRRPRRGPPGPRLAGTPRSR